jgi:hypothetical protein
VFQRKEGKKSMRRGSEKDICRRREVVTNEKTAINENGKSRDVDVEQRERDDLMYNAEDPYRELSPSKSHV